MTILAWPPAPSVKFLFFRLYPYEVSLYRTAVFLPMIIVFSLSGILLLFRSTLGKNKMTTAAMVLWIVTTVVLYVISELIVLYAIKDINAIKQI